MKEMTKEQMQERTRKLSKVLDTIPVWSNEWDETYSEYCVLTSKLDEIFRKENQKDFDAFYEEHIEGKSREELDMDDWGYYSDWHKDMYGYRPRFGFEPDFRRNEVF